MRAILLSVQPKRCELIANGNKTIYVRKTKPKIETPFKCYIYCTKEHIADDRLWIFGKKSPFGTSVKIANLCGAKDVGGAYNGNGKVIGEFVCDRVYELGVNSDDFNRWWHETVHEECSEKQMCLTWDEVDDYLGHAHGYGWHISDLVIYDESKELSEFMKPCIDNYGYCQGCKYGFCKYPEWVETHEDLEGCCFETECLNTVTKAPNSWCYVEEMRGEN